MLKQLPLFWSELHVRSWCGKTWLMRVWRLWDGSFISEELLDIERFEQDGKA
jgi:hypothetical protein